MTFAAMASWEAWILLLGAGALAAALFFIKLRPPRILIPSLALWQRVLDASPEATRWERIRRAVSLIVTVAIAIAIALAIARPSRLAGRGTVGHGRILVVLDSSWSMLARTRERDTRWDRAIAEARRLAASSDQVAIATTADGLVEGPTDEAVLIEAAIGSLRPAGGDATSWPAVAGLDAVHFITDGAVPRQIDPAVIVHSVFEPGGNVAITAFEVRPSLAPDRRGPGSQIGQAYLEVANFALTAQKVHITLVRGNVTIADNRVDMAAGEAYRQVIALARQGDPALRAHVEAADNALDLDDDGFAWMTRARLLSIRVVGDHTEWLRRLFAGDPDVRATFVSPSEYRDGGEGEDVTIFDRWAPPSPSAHQAIYFAPPADTSWLAGAGQPVDDERRPRWETIGAHPVLRGVDPLTLRIDRARGYSSPLLVPVARSTRGTPLVYAGESGERRLLLVTFGPLDSNLASAPGFPVLIGNALDWLARPEVRDLSLRPGIASFSEATGKVTAPDGAPVALTRINGTRVGMLRVPGLYAVEAGGARSTIAVNTADPQRSNVAHTSLAPGTGATAARGVLERPWWLACAIAAFALAFAEWWTWQRRLTL